MGRQSVWEYFRALYGCYRQAARETKRKILDNFVPTRDPTESVPCGC